jgi:tRNA A22 N-methylase
MTNKIIYIYIALFALGLILLLSFVSVYEIIGLKLDSSENNIEQVAQDKNVSEVATSSDAALSDEKIEERIDEWEQVKPSRGDLTQEQITEKTNNLNVLKDRIKKTDSDN